MAAAVGPLAGVEVPVLGSDKVQWVEITVLSSFSSPSPPPSGAAASRDAAGCYIIPGDPKAYLIWRLHKNQSNVLEIIELFACKEFPQTGLHLVFQDALFPFCYLCKNEIQHGAGNAYLLYVFTVSGVAYLLSLRIPLSYASGSTFPQSDLVEFNVQSHAQSGNVTAVVASSECLLTGRQDGSIGCYQLGKLDPSSPGFFYELRDDAGIGRLWNIMSRGKIVGPVKDMVISELCGRKLLYVLHADGYLRVWDLISHIRIISHTVSSHELGGTNMSRLWVGEANNHTNFISLAILHGDALVSRTELVSVHFFDFSAEDKMVLSPRSSTHSIRLEGKLIDLKLNTDILWILNEEGTMLYDLSHSEDSTKQSLTYISQENFVADQLFQSSDDAFDDLALTTDFIFSSAKDQAAYFVSSMLLRRLLQPGVHQSGALRATLLEHKKYISDSELQTLTMVGLKKEIFAIIEGEGAAINSGAIVHFWKYFCSRYFHHWCHNSTPYSLLVDFSQDLVGLIRKNSISFFRPLEAKEHLIYDFSEDIQNIKSFRMTLTDNDIDSKVFVKVLRCMSHINNQLGRAAVAMFYESLINPLITSDDFVYQLLKMMETGYNPSFVPSLARQLEKKQTVHKSQRKFAIYILQSLNSLCSKDTNSAGVLDVIEKYLKILNPYKSAQISVTKGLHSVNSSLLIEATSQVARVTFEATFGVLLLLGYLVNVSGQVNMVQTDIAHIKSKLIPMTHEIVSQWVAIHFLATTPTTRPTIEDFSSRLSLLHLGNKADKRSWDGKLGSSDFTLAFLLDLPLCSGGKDFLFSTSLPNPSKLIHSVREFCSLIARSYNNEELPLSSSPAIELASVLVHNGQYEAAENLFAILNKYSKSKKVPLSSQTIDGDWPARLHLLGFCLLVRAQSELHGVLKEQKLCEAIRCFFSAASGDGAQRALKNVSFQTGFQPPDNNYGSAAIWRLHYYQWAMQIFEQYGLSEGACQFALAALEQVDVVELDTGTDDLALPETATIIRGRLWANVFKFTLDLKHYSDAYCAIISNPDEDSKFICLRRFIIVLCEHGAMKVLCDGKLPFVGLMEKVEQELVWKAERSDVFVKPNIYKLLYAFEASQNNWRKAAGFMYRYSERLKNEVSLDGNSQISSVLQERLQALSSAVNALQLVDRAYAWIDSRDGNSYGNYQGSPHKKPRNVLKLNSSVGVAPQPLTRQVYVDIEMLEKEYILTSAQYALASQNDNFKLSGCRSIETILDVLIHENFYDMAFTIILKFWKGSELKRQLERAFVAMSQKCCPSRVGPSSTPSNTKINNLLLTFSEEDPYSKSNDDASPAAQHFNGNGHWDTLELYLEKYKELHQRLPATVAETLLYTDPLIELPLWLVHMFKGGRRATSWGMTGRDSDPATLFRLYVDYGRHAEALNLLLEYLESFASLRPTDIMNRKKMSAIWFPYTAIDRLWCQLEELRNSGHMVDQCDRLKKMLQEALMNHLRMVEVDSQDVLASASLSETQNSCS